jgi:hypothetical protein
MSVADGCVTNLHVMHHYKVFRKDLNRKLNRLSADIVSVVSCLVQTAFKGVSFQKLSCIACNWVTTLTFFSESKFL